MNVADIFSRLTDLPYAVLALLIGAVLIIFPCVDVDKAHFVSSHAPTTMVPIFAGLALVLISATLTAYAAVTSGSSVSSGLDMSQVGEEGDTLWTEIERCQIRVRSGRIEDYHSIPDAVVVLPCNEYFSDECAFDPRSALGAYAKRAYGSRVDEFVALVQHEAKQVFGNGTQREKREGVHEESYDTGRCLLLLNPLGSQTAVALVSTTTERVGEGLAGEISYLFPAMCAVLTRFAGTRFNEIVMPLMGSGHGGISPARALVGLLLAAAEAVRTFHGRKPSRLTIVVFRKDNTGPAQVETSVARRALALIST